jgi:hypothetical protein
MNIDMFVNNILKGDGGLHQLKVGDEEVHPEFFDNKKISTFAICKPANFKLDKSLPVNCLGTLCVE